LSLKHCPGVKDLIKPTKIILRTCPTCEEEVEFFSDETESKCTSCGKTLYREATPSCVTWCDYANKCIDDMKNKGLIPPSRIEEFKHMAKK
jgi:hypothetical protein